jgi:hypothetical protein
MGTNVDFLALNWQQAEKMLVDWRTRLNGTSNGKRIGERDLLVLVALAGGAEHRRNHPKTDFHHYEFVEVARSILRVSGGCVLHGDLDDGVPDLACAWFPPIGIDVVVAAGRIHEHFRDSNAYHRPGWKHEKHALIGIGQKEYTAFQMLKLACCDETFVEPDVFAKLSDETRALAGTFRISAPNVSVIAAEAAQAAASAAKRMLAVFDRANEGQIVHKRLEKLATVR